MAGRLDKWEAQHRRNVERYAKMIDDIYNEAVREAASLSIPLSGIFSPDKPFSFADYPLTRNRVNNLLESLKNGVETAIVNGVRSEWTLAGNKNNELCNLVFGDNVGRLTEEQYRRYYSNNDKARDAFIARKRAGLDLSDWVWNYTNQFKDEIEMGLDLGLRDGLSADEMSRTLRQYLKYPDKLFRRVRDEHGQLHLSKNAAAFHPGQGVYRSSYKNARRLTATETNIAYRTADYVRHQQLDFVVGIEVHLSGNHTLNGKPFEDICDELEGKYPKDFKFTGWHPLCRCYTTTILKTEEEMAEDDRRIMAGEEPMPSEESENYVPDVPEKFGKWIDDNTERIERAKSLPYFMRDNEKYIRPLTITPQARAGADEAQKFNEKMMRAADAPHIIKDNRAGVDAILDQEQKPLTTPEKARYGAVTGTKLGRTATKAAFKVYEDMPAPTLTEEVTNNTLEIASAFGIKTPPKPMTFLEANEGRGNVLFGKGEEFVFNCQAAVAVHEARMRGLNVTALGYDPNVTSVSYKLGERFESIWRSPKTGKTPTPTMIHGKSFDDMLDKMEVATKATGRYHIGINMQENKGHVVTAERIRDGRIIFYDAQSGSFLNIEEYITNGVEYFEVLKVDKLLLREDIFKAIARVL